MRKNFLTVILMIYLLSNPLFSRVGPGQARSSMPDDFTGNFVLQQNPSIRVSIDHGWERDGWIPVVLTFGGLEVYQRVNADDIAAAAGIETGISKMLVEDMDISFFTYEQNPMRTRMELLDNSKPVRLKVNRKKRQVEVYVGNSRLKLKPIRVKFTEITPGELYELTFVGLKVRTQKSFIFLPSRGVIYTAPLRSTPFKQHPDPDKKVGWSKWAIKIDPGDEKVINKGEIKCTVN